MGAAETSSRDYGDGSVSGELQRRPHVLVQLAENSLAVAQSLRDNYFHNTARFISRLRLTLRDDGASEPITRLESVADAAMKQVKGVSAHLATHEVLPGEFFKWQGGYGAFSVSPRHLRRVSDYIITRRTHAHPRTRLRLRRHRRPDRVRAGGFCGEAFSLGALWAIQSNGTSHRKITCNPPSIQLPGYPTDD